MIIKPTVGRIVWFWENHLYEDDEHTQPQAAIVTYVHSDSNVNLCVFTHNGAAYPVTSVELVQEGAARPEYRHYCQWMPYQIGQAKKHAEDGYASPLGKDDVTGD